MGAVAPLWAAFQGVAASCGAEPWALLLCGLIAMALAWAILAHGAHPGHTPGPGTLPVVGCMFHVLWHYDRLYDWLTDTLARSPTLTCRTFRPGVEEVFTANPECVEHVLKDRFENYPKGALMRDIMGDFMGCGIFNSDGDLWRKQRKTAAMQFTAGSLKGFTMATLQEEIRTRLWPTLDAAALVGTPLDLQDVLLRLSFDNICQVGFGVDPHCLGPGVPEVPFAAAFNTVAQAPMRRFLLPEWAWKVRKALNMGFEREQRKAVKLINAFVDDTVRVRLEELGRVTSGGQGDVAAGAGALARMEGLGDPKEPAEQLAQQKAGEQDKPKEREKVAVTGLQEEGRRGFTVHGAERRGELPNKDLLSRFIVLQQTSEAQREHFLRDVVTNFIVAGRDTSSLTLTWFFWQLSHHPEVADKILAKLDSIDAQPAGIASSKALQPQGLQEAAGSGAHTGCQLGEGISTDNVAGGLGRPGAGQSVRQAGFDELRRMTYLHAALNETLRLCPAVPLDFKTAEANDVLPDGTQVRKGARVTYVIYAMGRMRSIWGEDALEFRPERWLTPQGALRVESPFKFVAFNAGPRTCLGRDMAYVQMKSVASAILRKYRLAVVPGQSGEYALSITMPMKHGLRVTVRHRG